MKSTMFKFSMRTQVIAIVLLAMIGFTFISIYSVLTANENKSRMNSVTLIHFPVLERIDANIVRLDKMKELFSQAVAANEMDLLDDVNTIFEEGTEVFDEIKEIHPPLTPKIVTLKENFKYYYSSGATTTIALLEGKLDADEINHTIRSMISALKLFQTELTVFRAEAYKKFTGNIDNAKEDTARNLQFGMLVSVMNMGFMGVLIYFIFSNTKMMKIIEEQNLNLENKVEERTAQLQSKTRDIHSMLNNLRQGVFTVDKKQRIHPEYSGHMETIFNTNEIANRDVIPLLFDHAKINENDLDQVRVSLDSILGEYSMCFDFNQHLLSKEIEAHFPGESKKILEVDWNPIVTDEDIVEKILVVVRDVTELKRLQRESEKQKRELDIVGQILEVERNKFRSFMRGTFEFIEENQKLIKKSDRKDPEILQSLFRNMHTVKGNARTYGFHFITDIIHKTEKVYDDLRNNESMQWNREVLLKDLDVALEAVREYEVVYQQKLKSHQKTGSFGKQFQEALTLSLNQVGVATPETLNTFYAQVKRLVEQETSSTLETIVHDIVKSIDSIAEELEKPTPNVVISGNGIHFDDRKCKLLQDTLVHCFRNALDHGIESPEKRVVANKAEQGTIMIESIQDAQSIKLFFRDDGAGLNLPAIRAKALNDRPKEWSEGEEPTDEQLAEMIFYSGVSTAEQVTQISGRGVGMNTVREFLKGEGGDISVHYTGDQLENGFRQFEYQINLPL